MNLIHKQFTIELLFQRGKRKKKLSPINLCFKEQGKIKRLQTFTSPIRILFVAFEISFFMTVLKHRVINKANRKIPVRSE
jgi:hypothetical protein